MQEAAFPDQIQTERLILRKPVVSDALAYQRLLNANVREFVLYGDWNAYKATYSLEEVTQDLAERISNTAKGIRVSYMIETCDKDLIGWIALRNIYWDLDCCTMGYVLDKSHWGRGFMGEALQGVEGMLKGIGFNRLEARINVYNERSIKLAQRSNYTCEGVLHAVSKHLFDVEAGRPYSDMAIYAKFLKGTAPAQN